MKKFTFFLTLNVIFVLYSCGTNELLKVDTKLAKKQYNKVSDSLNKDLTINESFYLTYAKVTDYLPKNYSVLGDIDYTNYIQKALNEERNLIFPNFPLLVNDKGIAVKSNSIVIFPEGSKLILSPSDKVWYTILALNNVENVKLYGPIIEGDKYRRLKPNITEGEWGMGIWMASARNIEIYAPKVEKCWGDGIYIGKGDINKPNNKILITDPYINDNRRNGISIVSGKNVTINNAIISNTNGKSPEAGIDIEPNGNDDVIENITINNPHTINNAYLGIVVSLGSMVGEKAKNVSVEIRNHKDEYSYHGFVLASIRKEVNKNDKKIRGDINIVEPVWKFNKVPYALGVTRGLFPSLKIDKPIIFTVEDTVNANQKLINRLSTIKFDGSLEITKI
ncbi:right-handed parallel beta-helix repeat-containing protein [Dokdonia sp. 4H-3-7-5]|uniref:right-handed parallel beta-helix repeat-containing protein n=1 Tax=Dokdonia sp. (strain 4H-3-7-5) TaxID=983548 RepID=UPI00020A6DD9|nr:right-handed parallel beta-helix repeat-containing protein [Dokdonia sp. 4H-3-7-5]AEE20739.1 hypothetical protein Krodi_2764 [Dokdonia sp. 4H-3-7-5]